MPGVADYPQNHNELSHASLKIQALHRGRQERSHVRKKRATLALANDSSSSPSSTAKNLVRHGDWIEIMDPAAHANYYYNSTTILPLPLLLLGR